MTHHKPPFTREHHETLVRARSGNHPDVSLSQAIDVALAHLPEPEVPAWEQLEDGDYLFRDDTRTGDVSIRVVRDGNQSVYRDHNGRPASGGVPVNPDERHLYEPVLVLPADPATLMRVTSTLALSLEEVVGVISALRVEKAMP